MQPTILVQYKATGGIATLTYQFDEPLMTKHSGPAQVNQSFLMSTKLPPSINVIYKPSCRFCPDHKTAENNLSHLANVDLLYFFIFNILINSEKKMSFLISAFTLLSEKLCTIVVVFLMWSK